MKASGIILCGGQGSRMGGADKGLMPWGDHSCVEAVAARLEPQVDDIVISANRNLERYSTLGYPVVRDAYIGYAGPLAGVAASLPHCRHPIAAVVPCDSPEPPADLVARLLEPLRDADIDLSYAFDGDRHQYLFMALRRQLLQQLQHYLDSGQRSVKGWHRLMRHQVVDFSDCPEAFVNLNEA